MFGDYYYCSEAPYIQAKEREHKDLHIKKLEDMLYGLVQQCRKLDRHADYWFYNIPGLTSFIDDKDIAQQKIDRDTSIKENALNKLTLEEKKALGL